MLEACNITIAKLQRRLQLDHLSSPPYFSPQQFGDKVTIAVQCLLIGTVVTGLLLFPLTTERDKQNSRARAAAFLFIFLGAVGLIVFPWGTRLLGDSFLAWIVNTVLRVFLIL